MFVWRITVTSHEFQGVANLRQLHCVFESMFKLLSKKTSQLCITGHLWGESTVLIDEFPFTKGSDTQGVHDVTSPWIIFMAP